MREQLSVKKVSLVNQLLESDTRPNPFYDAVVKKIGTDENLRVLKFTEPGKHYAFYIGTFQQTLEEIRSTRPLRLEKTLIDKLEKELAIDIPDGETAPAFEVESIELYVESIKRYTKIKTQASLGIIEEYDLAEFVSAHGVLPRRSFAIQVHENGKLVDNTKTRTIRLNTNGIDVTNLLDKPVVVTSLNRYMIREQLLAVLNGKLDQILVFPEDVSLPATHFVEGNRYVAHIRNTSLICYGQIEFKVDLTGGEDESGSFLMLNDGTPLKTNNDEYLVIS